MDFNQIKADAFSHVMLQHSIPENTDIIFVSDFFVEQVLGGAELTSDALLQSTNLNVAKLNSRNVTVELLEKHQSKHWIFANISQLNHNLLPTIATNLKYSCILYDYSFCKYRSIEKHSIIENKACNCSNELLGKLISTFVYQASSLWFMSEAQQNIWFKHFPFLADIYSTVLSSVFSEDFFKKLMQLKQAQKSGQIIKNNKALVVNSDSWIKGTKEAIDYCTKNNIDYELVGNLDYDKMLAKLAECGTLVYLPPGDDTCPRLVIEAKLLDCDLILNTHVQHAAEEWFSTDDLGTIISYLYLARERFWNGMREIISFNPSLSGYTTTFNAKTNDYPFVESITSLAQFCDEVIVVDAGSTDGTYEELQLLKEKFSNIKLFQHNIDLSKKRWAISIDGHLKAYARALTRSEFCWQMDCDEVVHENDYQKIRNLCKNFPKSVNILCLPVIEYFDGLKNVRSRVAWKWRLSRNLPQITHDVPIYARDFDNDGELFVKPFLDDSCSYVDVNSYGVINAATFYLNEADTVCENNIDEYEKWFNSCIEMYPSVFHFSWFNLKRKIKSYIGKQGWADFQKSMYNLDECNFMFATSSPTDTETDDKVGELRKNGPHIFHQKMSDETKNNEKLISINREHPVIMNEWINRNA